MDRRQRASDEEQQQEVDVLPFVAIRDLNRTAPDPAEMRTANLRRFAERLDTVIQRHAAEMTPNDRREADAALRGLIDALDEADRVAALGRRPDVSRS